MQHKKLKPVVSLLAVFVFGLFIMACNNGASSEKKTEGDTGVKKTEAAPAPPDTLKKKDTLDGKPTETSN